MHQETFRIPMKTIKYQPVYKYPDSICILTIAISLGIKKVPFPLCFILTESGFNSSCHYPGGVLDQWLGIGVPLRFFFV